MGELFRCAFLSQVSAVGALLASAQQRL